ncbi:hypothetical protein [Microvirga brassicacearum]|uniref:hypothetical protein n=1 Tax=Microvirga brassicacearum TaxID=2580413 RepID=UPI001FCE8928|nr:hypothetical protein [Microvirga brassicacearum]
MLRIEDGFDPSLMRALAQLGHPVEEIGPPYPDAVGQAGMIVRHARNGRVAAMHDPRGEGGATGL